MSLLQRGIQREPFAVASRFRDDFFECLTVRGNTLFELTDALLCADGPVTTLVDLTLTAEHRRGHGAIYEALNNGNVDVPRLRQVLAGLSTPATGSAPTRRPAGTAVLPRLRPQRTALGPVHPGLAVLVRRRPRIGPDVLAPAPGHRPSRA